MAKEFKVIIIGILRMMLYLQIKNAMKLSYSEHLSSEYNIEDPGTTFWNKLHGLNNRIDNYINRLDNYINRLDN